MHVLSQFCRVWTARRSVPIEILLVNAVRSTTVYEKSYFKRRLQQVSDLKVTQGEMVLFDRLFYIALYWWSVTTTSLSWTVSEIPPLYQRISLPVTSFSYDNNSETLWAAFALWFALKYNVVNMCYSFRGTVQIEDMTAKVVHIHW